MVGVLTKGLCSPKFSFSSILRALQKKYATGRPDQKDLNENLAATQGLAHMIIECNRLFEVQAPGVGMIGSDRMYTVYTRSLTSCFYTSVRSLMRWLHSHVIHTWRLTCTHPQLASCANKWKTMMERTKHIWREDFRMCLKRPEKSPSTGCHAAALITQSFTIRRLVFSFVNVTYIIIRKFQL